MCGIFGFNFNDQDLADACLNTFAYRGPDARGKFSDNIVTLGHNRLSIIDLDPRSNQPMFDASGKLAVVFNGEIYNYQELKNNLSKKYIFNTSSDTEVLLYAYKEYGEEICKYLQGMYAFVIYDKDKELLFLARDYLGIKPLIYYYDGRRFIFSSEMKGISKALKQLEIGLDLNRENSNLFLSLGYIPSPLTLYNNIKKLKAGHSVIFNLKTNLLEEPQPYEVEVNDITKNQDELQAVIEKSIMNHLMADVPVGLFFSGGTDSSLIASVLNKYGVDLETFSIRLEHKKNDNDYTNKIIEQLKLKNSIKQFDVSDFDGIYDELMSKLDEPMFDASIFPTYLVSKLSKDKARVVLSGEGGDEFFSGYSRQKHIRSIGDKADYEFHWLDRLYVALPFFKFKSRLFKGLFLLFSKPISFYLADISSGKDLIDYRSVKRFIQEASIRPSELDIKLYLENDLLRKTDFATSYNSQEGRVPLLDINITKSSRNFEDKKIVNGVGKFVLKMILAKYLPDDLVFRDKSGFNVSLSRFFMESSKLKPDYYKAVQYLADNKVLHRSFLDKGDFYFINYPFFCFGIISLYRVIENNKNI